MRSSQTAAVEESASRTLTAWHDLWRVYATTEYRRHCYYIETGAGSFFYYAAAYQCIYLLTVPTTPSPSQNMVIVTLHYKQMKWRDGRLSWHGWFAV